MLVFFDGDELDQVEIALHGATQADTIDLTIEGCDSTHDTYNVSGMPDGTAITNGSASVSNKGGTSEWVTWQFGETGPTPSGPHWIVLAPSSSGAFDIQTRTAYDWGLNDHFCDLVSFERLYTTAWSGNITTGPTPLRVKKKDGTYLKNVQMGHPPVSSVSETFNARAVSGTNVLGVKFTAPYAMELLGVSKTPYYISAYIAGEMVLVDSSDVELARVFPAECYNWPSNYTNFTPFANSVTLTAGGVYRIYLKNPAEDANKVGFQTVTIASGDYTKFFLNSGDWEYTYADNPPSEGGSGTWTDVATEIPFLTLIARQDLSELGTGSGIIMPSVRSY